MLKNWRFQTVVLEKTLESPPDSKDIKPVNLKGNQLWIFIGRTGAKAEAPILWLPDMMSQTHWKRPWCWERWRAGGEEGERGWDVGWHHWLTGHEFEQTLGEMMKDREAWHAAIHGISKSRIYWATEQQQSTHHSSPFSLLQEALGLHLWTPLFSCFQLDADNWVTGGQRKDWCMYSSSSLQIDFLFSLGSGNHSFSIALAGLGVVRAHWMAPSLFGFLSPCSQISRYSLY